MNNRRNEFEREFAQVEEAIFAARDYVAPSDDLRPRTLEIARAQAGRLYVFRMICFFGLASLFVWLVCLPAARALRNLRPHIVAPSSTEVERSAYEHSSLEQSGHDWALMETFERLRGQDAPRSGPTNIAESSE